MANPLQCAGPSPGWSLEAFALATQAKVLSGNKLEQLVVRLQRHSGRTREACWRFVIQYGLKGKGDHRRWTEQEIEFVREELVKRPVEEIAKRLSRSSKSVRSMLFRQGLHVRVIRCDLFSIESLARAIRVSKGEIHYWIRQGWLEASVDTSGSRSSYRVTPEALKRTYTHHLMDLIRRGIPNQLLFEAYVQYVHSPKHTVGEQLLDVRRDKRERAAYAEVQGRETARLGSEGGVDDDEEDEDAGEEEYSVFLDDLKDSHNSNAYQE